MLASLIVIEEKWMVGQDARENGYYALQSLSQLLTDRFDVSGVYLFISDCEQPPTSQFGEQLLRAL